PAQPHPLPLPDALPTPTLTLQPAEAGSGITFVREQDGKTATIPAHVANVLKRPRRTCLRNGTLFVETIEHCMAALSGMGIDNAVDRKSTRLNSSHVKIS